jgi:hypothetical protein
VCLYASYDGHNKKRFFFIQHKPVGNHTGKGVRLYATPSVARNLEPVCRFFSPHTLSYGLKMLMSKFIFSVLIKLYLCVFIGIPTLYRYMFQQLLPPSGEPQILNTGFEIIK